MNIETLGTEPTICATESCYETVGFTKWKFCNYHGINRKYHRECIICGGPTYGVVCAECLGRQ